jgi:signal transduction histidine kinase/CheY-like chemotaxis protein
LLQTVPLLPPTITCGAVADLFGKQPTVPAFVVQMPKGGYGLVDRNSYMTRYLERYNRDIFQRRPITALVDGNPLVVDHDAPIKQVGLLVTSERPDALKTAFVITRGGDFAGVAMGADLMRAVARLAEEASVAKTTFLTNMSHEIRTPLNAVIGNLELLAATALDGEQSDLARMASVSAHTLLELIGDLLDLSKIEADRLEIEMVNCDVRAVIDEVLTIAMPRAKQKGLRLVGWVGAAVPATIRSDPLRLRQVLLNFVGNAVKFTQTGGVFLSARARLDDSGTELLHFEVTDTGPGFDPARAAALFEPFVQEDASTTRRFGGTGLGLAIARRIVEILGGRLGCSTEPGLGATFWATLPVAVAATGTESRPAHAPAVFPACVALVGSDMKAVDAVTAALAAAGIAVSRSGTAAIVPEGTAAIVLDQADTTRTLEAIAGLVERGIAPLLLTADPSRALHYQAYRHGARHVLLYPGEIGEITALLETPEATREHAAAADPRVTTIAAAPGEALVLVIDDTGTNRELAARQLAKLGLRCETAENGLIGLEMTESRHYALILVDGSMPVMDGFEFARRFRERQSARGDGRTPILAVTAHALAGDAERFIAAGMDDYLAKPVTLEKLRGKLSTWLAAGAAALPAPAPVEAGGAIDRAALAEMLGEDDPVAIAELLTVFLADFPGLAQPVAAAIATGDRAALARAAHAGKSAAGSAAARPLAALLARLEAMAPEGDVDTLSALERAVRLEFARVEAEVNALAASAAASAPVSTPQSV